MAFDSEAECWVNLAGSYDYLELPYYVSQDYENEQRPVRPTCKEMLDAYVTPLFLEKAKLHGLPIPEYYISNGYFEPPVVVDPINPFMTKARTVLSPGRQESTARSMTRNFTYAICCQDIPAGAKVTHFRAPSWIPGPESWPGDGRADLGYLSYPAGESTGDGAGRRPQIVQRHIAIAA